MSPEQRLFERHRQAAYLYSIIQSAENSEDGAPTKDVERAFDAGLLFAARLVLDNEAADNDWTEDLSEYAEEIRRRAAPGTSLPDSERKVVEAAIEWREECIYDEEYPTAGAVAQAAVKLRATVEALEEVRDA